MPEPDCIIATPVCVSIQLITVNDELVYYTRGGYHNRQQRDGNSRIEAESPWMFEIRSSCLLTTTLTQLPEDLQAPPRCPLPPYYGNAAVNSSRGRLAQWQPRRGSRELHRETPCN